MPWVVGIDEAGYGPNLGPLVQAAVGLDLPDDDPAGWDTLQAAVRRSHEPDDGRLLIDDSKKVYTRGGLEALERGAFGLSGTIPQSLESFLAFARRKSSTELREEIWFDPSEGLPLASNPESLREIHRRFHACYRAGAMAIQLSTVMPRRFNSICEEQGTKGAVLSQGLVDLMSGISDLEHVGIERSANRPIVFHCDKHGGRNFYAAMVQAAFPDGWVIAERESAAESRYRIAGLARQVTVVFRPRADAESVAVALASMMAKYVREVFMRQFNRFWAKHVPGLKPTAGYPGDAKRFYAEIRDAMTKLGLSEDQVWRNR